MVIVFSGLRIIQELQTLLVAFLNDPKTTLSSGWSMWIVGGGKDINVITLPYRNQEPV